MTDPSPPGRASRRRNGWLLALTLICAWVVVLTFVLPRRRPDLAAPQLEVGPGVTKADFSWAFEDLNGRPATFDRFRGRAVFLNIWATWCGPCLTELPSIVNLAADPRLKDVAFVAMSVDESPETLRRFVAERKLTLPVYRATSLADAFQTAGIPATFVIAPDGTIVGSLVGSARWDTPENVELLESLAKKARAAP